jgi:RNase P subunit RPR2
MIKLHVVNTWHFCGKRAESIEISKDIQMLICDHCKEKLVMLTSPSLNMVFPLPT